MAGKPQRSQTKISIHTTVSKEACRLVHPILLTEKSNISSFSGLFEAIVFLSEHMYIEEPDNGFITNLLNIKIEKLGKQLAQPALEEKRRVHICIDRDACAFINMLSKKYRSCFSSRSELSDLLLLNIGRSCNTSSAVDYYCRRLNEVLSLHPYRQ